MRVLVLLAALPAAVFSVPAMAQTSCAYGTPRDCFDGRDITDRKNRDDLTNRTRIVAVSTVDVTDRKLRDDLRDRTLACP